MPGKMAPGPGPPDTLVGELPRGQVGSHVLRSRWKQRLGGGPGLCLGGWALSLPRRGQEGWTAGSDAADRRIQSLRQPAARGS